MALEKLLLLSSQFRSSGFSNSLDLSFLVSYRPGSVSRTPTKIGEKLAVQTHEACGVLLLGKTLDLDDIHLGLVLRVREGDVVIEVALSGEESLRLEVRVELLDDRERRAKDVLGNVSHRNIVGQPDLVANALKLSAASIGQHSKC